MQGGRTTQKTRAIIHSLASGNLPERLKRAQKGTKVGHRKHNLRGPLHIWTPRNMTKDTMVDLSRVMTYEIALVRVPLLQSS